MVLVRRALLGAAAATLAAPALRAQEVVVKMGALRLIHSIAPFLYERFQPAGMKIPRIRRG